MQLVLGPAAVDGVLRVEDREMLADDLVRRITADALRAGVPRDDAAVGIEHEDRVVDDAVDEQPESFFAFCQRLLVRAPLGQVARDFREADQRTGLVTKRGDDDV
ncbi:MAG TPA: hypothetical protein VFM89_04535, partial [Casimicrobiaceae bacterium]|nr:hypothetical protein [Casimicrobiaceae bacterium]